MLFLLIVSSFISRKKLRPTYSEIFSGFYSRFFSRPAPNRKTKLAGKEKSRPRSNFSALRISLDFSAVRRVIIQKPGAASFFTCSFGRCPRGENARVTQPRRISIGWGERGIPISPRRCFSPNRMCQKSLSAGQNTLSLGRPGLNLPHPPPKSGPSLHVQ